MIEPQLWVDAPWLQHEPTRTVLALLNADGEEGRVVGGAVRDALLGLPIGDIDIATTARPDEVMRRADAAEIRAVPTGVEHGTVTLIAGDRAFEVTTLREDVETFGRKAKVVFGRNWRRDAERRDFTINGLSLDAGGGVHDYVGGLADIDARRVRFIGDADRRIAEDYLRIWRFFRFHAGYGAGDPDAGDYRACLRGRGGLSALSAERIRAELLKLLVAPRAFAAVEAMADGGLLAGVLGVVYLGPLRAMIALEQRHALAPDALRRLAAAAAATGADAGRLAARLRLSNAEAKRLAGMADGWWRFEGLSETSARAAIYSFGAAAFRDRALLALARGVVLDPALVGLPERWTAPDFPLKAADLIARGIAPGPALGRALARAEAEWLAQDMPLEADVLEAIADSAAQRGD